MRKVLASIVLLCMACLNAQCQKAEVHKNDGTTVEIPVEEILRVDLYGTSVLLEEFGMVICNTSKRHTKQPSTTE